MKLHVLAFLLILALVSCKSAHLRKEAATDQITNLKESFLLVRLHSGNVKAEALRAAGREEAAHSWLAEQAATNRRIREAFTSEFDYCPVYFFDAETSGAVRSRDFQNVLLNSDLAAIYPSRIPDRSFLVAEFSRIRQTTDQSGMEALIVLNDSLQQLEPPFPYYVRTTFFGEEDKERKSVRLLNAAFYNYYAQSRIWQEKRELKRRRRALRRIED